MSEWTNSEGGTLTGKERATLTGGTYLRGVARGDVKGASTMTGFGSADLGTVTDVDLWPLASTQNIPDLLSSAVAATVQSDSAQDSVGGTGVSAVNVIIINGDGEEAVVPVTLTGTTAVNVTGFRFGQCMYSTAGTAAAGNITVTYGGATYLVMPIGENRCLSSGRAVPAGKRYLVSSVHLSTASGSGSAKVDAHLLADSIMNTRYAGIYFSHAPLSAQNGEANAEFDPPLIFPSLSVVKVGRVTTSNSAHVSAIVHGHYEDDI